MATTNLKFHRITATTGNTINTSTAYVKGDVYFIKSASGNTGKVYICTTAGTGSAAVLEDYSVDTNTWRGIQNNLTSTSTTDSLSAAQGKALKDAADALATRVTSIEDNSPRWDKRYDTASSDTRGHWTVTIPGITELYDGLVIKVKLSTSYYGNNESYNTLNLNNLGPKMVWYSYNSRFTTHFGANAFLTLTYKTTAGSYKVTTSTGELTNGTTYTDGWVLESDYNSTDVNRLRSYYCRFYTGEVVNRYKLCALGADERVHPISLTDGNTVAHAGNTVAFKPEQIFYNWTSTVTQNANTVMEHACLYSAAYLDNTCRYTFSGNIPAYSSVYLKGTYDHSTGLFTLDTTSNTSWYVAVPTNTVPSLSSYFTNGSYYISIGQSYSSANYMNLYENNELFYFDGTNLRDGKSAYSYNMLDGLEDLLASI